MKAHVLPAFLLAFCLILTPCALAQAPQPDILELVGQIGGASHAVAVDGNYAYLGVGPRLVVLNITDKVNPSFVGRSPLLPGIVQGITVVDNYAYVADGLGGLQIINVSNREQPSLAGSCTEVGDARYVAIDKATYRAYVASWGRHGEPALHIVNISAPSNPSLLSSCLAGMSATGVANLGPLVLVAASGDGLAIVDTSDPELPKVIETVQTGVPNSMAMDVALGEAEEGGAPWPITIRAYVADLNAGLCVVPITQTGLKVPPTVGTITRYPTVGPDDPPANIDARGVTLTKKHVFVANGRGQKLWIASLADLGKGEPFWVAGGSPYGVVVQGSYAYLTVQRGNGLSILDLGDDPLELPDLCYPSRYTGIAKASSAAISGDHAFIGDSGNDCLWAVDISDPAGWRVEPNPLTYLNQPADMAIAGSYAYVASVGVDRRMTVVDISNPQRLNLGRRGHVSTGGDTWGVAVQDSYAYLATAHTTVTSTLDIVDVRDPLNLTLEGQVELQGGDARAVAIAGGLASLAAYDTGLHLVDVSNPGAPTAQGTYAANEAASVAAAPGRAYLAGHQGLSIVDTSDPANPSAAGLLPLTAPSHVAASGDWAFVAAQAPTGAYTLHAVNAAQPGAPVDEATYPIPWQPGDISVAGDYLCLADGEGGLYVFRLNLPAPPTYKVYLPLVLRG